MTMNQNTLPSSQAIFSELRDAAELLQKPALIQLVATIESHKGNNQICLLLLGESDGKHYALANTLLGEDLLPNSMHPAAMTPIRLSHDSKTVSVRHESNGTVALLSQDALLDALFLRPGEEEKAGIFGSSNQTQEIQISGPYKILESCTVALENIERIPEVENEQWLQILCGTDYAVFVLRATAILSLAQKGMIKANLLPAMGAGRLALVIDRMCALKLEERQQVLKFVRAYFAGQEALPVLLSYESRPMDSGQEEADAWQQEFRDYVQREVIKQHPRLRSESILQGVRLSVAAIEHTAQKTLQDMTGAEERIARLQKDSDLNAEKLARRSAKTRNRVELHVDSFLKENALQSIEGFAAVIRQQLAGEIEAAGVTTQTAHALPGYLEMLWAEHFRRILPEVQAEMLATVKPILDEAVRDVQAITKDNTADLNSLALELMLTTSEMPFYLPRIQTQSEGHNLGQTVVSGISNLLGLPAQITAGSEPESSSAEKMVQTVLPALRQIETQIKTETERRFTDITSEYADAVTHFYQNAINTLHTQVQQERDKQEQLLSRRSEIEALLTTQVPLWNQQLAEMSTH